MRKVTVELIQNLSAALTEKDRQLAEALALNHDLSQKLAAANVALLGLRKIRDEAQASSHGTSGPTT